MTLSKSNTFHWSTYADATLAGLSVLIPIPFMDDLLENFFRKRMLRTINQRHQRTLRKETILAVNHTPQSWSARLRSCLLLPVRFVVELVLSLSRKILYFLSIKKAIDALSYYWQRAYLLDYMLAQGYLQHDGNPEKAVAILEQVLREHSQSPLTQLAGELVRSPRRLIRAVRRARQGADDPALIETQNTMRSAWGEYDSYFIRLQERFDALYQVQ